ncbi:Pantoate-beta-alanine ligase [Peniophora sp. CONT]|nr:Pantoate-beta-alanine ligase [Peniophora sp. CONT]
MRFASPILRLARTMSTSEALPKSDIPIFATVSAYREWREAAFHDRKSVGFVPTMGALHDGHLSLVKHSLAANDHTVVSIFVNPAQFAPHEDLATYPRTLPEDLAALTALAGPAGRMPSAVFLPPVREMYPSGITQDVSAQRGTFVEVKGLSEPGEGRTRPTFFRGVATVVTKLFNIVQPTNAYFGQKDIQQAMLLRRLVGDLLLANPTPERLHIIRTTRDLTSGLALSSRNAYLSPAELGRAPALYAALRAAEDAWASGANKHECLKRAEAVLEEARLLGQKDAVTVKSDYIEFFDPSSFQALDEAADRSSRGGLPTVLTGAMWVGKTRLIDNLVLDDDGTIVGR